MPTLLLEQMSVEDFIKGYLYTQQHPAANATAMESATVQDWIDGSGVARLTIPLYMEPSIKLEYTFDDDEKTLWKYLTSAYKAKLKLNIIEIWNDHWSITLLQCRCVNNNL